MTPFQRLVLQGIWLIICCVGLPLEPKEGGDDVRKIRRAVESWRQEMEGSLK